MPYLIKVVDTFSAAHAIHGYNGDCANLHGHTWKVEVEVAVSKLNELGIGIDFRDVKNALSNILSEFDHSLLINDIDTHKYTKINVINTFEDNPTAEIIAREIYYSFQSLDYSINAVTVWEGNNNSVTYYK